MKFDLSAEQHYINWMTTYRAALTGLYAGVHFTAEEMDRLAARAADIRHGPLELLQPNPANVLPPVSPQPEDLSSK